MWATINHEYPGGGSTKLEVGSNDPAYPDAAAEMVARVLDMWRECIATETESSP